MSTGSNGGGMEMAPPLTVRSEPVLQASSITKRYGPVEALRQVDISVYAGEVVGLVGDNGAGK